MPTDEHFRKLERMYLSAPTNDYYNPTIEISKGRARVSIPVEAKHFHAAHAVHGSVYFKALDDAAFFAVQSLVEDVFVLTVSFTLYLTRPITEGVMHSTGKVVHASKRLFLAESVIVDSQGKQTARGNGSFMFSEIKLEAQIGYK
jgi:uncharacterized protein (TIGR00369 family)